MSITFTPEYPVLVFKPQVDERSPLETFCEHIFEADTFKIVVPKGRRTDLASVPSWLLWLFGPFSKHQRGALLHDELYRRKVKPCSRRLADEYAHEIWIHDGVPGFTAWLMWLAVRCFGRKAWGEPMTPGQAPMLRIFAATLVLAATLAGACLAEPLDATCRIIAAEGSGHASKGSGVLVHVNEHGRGLVLSNYHVVRDNPRGPFEVIFRDGSVRGANLVAGDDPRDLAAFEIDQPPTQPVPFTTGVTKTLHAAGFGEVGNLQVMSGTFTKQYQDSKSSFGFTNGVRNGDSGGPLFNDQWQLCGIVWGADGREGYAVHPQNVAAMLARCGVPLVRETNAYGYQIQCTPGVIYRPAEQCRIINGVKVCPQQTTPQTFAPPYAPPVAPQPRVSTQPPAAAPCTCQSDWVAIKERVTAVDQRIASVEARAAEQYASIRAEIVAQLDGRVEQLQGKAQEAAAANSETLAAVQARMSKLEASATLNQQTIVNQVVERLEASQPGNNAEPAGPTKVLIDVVPK